MPYTLYDYLNADGTNDFKAWSDSLEKRQLAKLNQKLDMLAINGEDLLPDTLSDTTVPGIRKLRVRGPVQLRPLLSRGPVNNHTEYTLLMGAKEVGSKWSPRGAPDTAQTRKDAVFADPENRRVNHERSGR